MEDGGKLKRPLKVMQRIKRSALMPTSFSIQNTFTVSVADVPVVVILVVGGGGPFTMMPLPCVSPGTSHISRRILHAFNTLPT